MWNISTNDSRCTRDIKFMNAIAETAFGREKTFHQQTGLKLKEGSRNATFGA
jgi:hypothetical protein